MYIIYITPIRYYTICKMYNRSQLKILLICFIKKNITNPYSKRIKVATDALAEQSVQAKQCSFFRDAN